MLACVCVLVLGCSRVANAELDGLDDYEADEEQPIKPRTSKPASTKTSAKASMWDEDEFEGIPNAAKPSRPAPTGDTAPPKKREYVYPLRQKHYHYEMVAGALLLLYLVNYLVGSRKNNRIASKWASTFATREGVFAKNFAWIGPGSDKYKFGATLLTKESPSEFKFYASGRHYCESMTATLKLRRRHDLYAYIWYAVSPTDDTLVVEVKMNEDAMDPFVFVVARAKITKALAAENSDVKHTQAVSGPSGARKPWMAPAFAARTEFQEVTDALLSEAVITSVLSEEAASDGPGKYFDCMYFSDSNPEAEHRRMLTFKFRIPSDPADMARLLDLVPRYIDATGRLRLSERARAKSSKNRQKLAEEKSKETRQEAAWTKQQEKRDAKAAALEAMTPKAREKQEEKDRKKALKKSEAKMKISKAH